MDISGITAERAVNGSGSEWSSAEEALETETHENQVDLSFEEQRPLSSEVEKDHRAVSRILARCAMRRATRKDDDTHVLCMLLTDDPELDKQVHARLVVVDSSAEAFPGVAQKNTGTVSDKSKQGVPARRSRAPQRNQSPAPQENSLASCIASHAGTWPVWDVNISRKY